MSSRCQAFTYVIRNNLHSAKKNPPRANAHSLVADHIRGGSNSWGLRLKHLQKHPNIMQGRALTNSQACFLNNALSAFAYLHRWPLNAMSSGRWLALEQIGLLPALSSRRSVFLVASERSLCFYHKAGIGVEKKKRRGRERERR